MQFQKVIIGLVLVVVLLTAAYFLQPVKRGKGMDTQSRYELELDWPQINFDVTLGQPSGIGTDTSQNLVVFHRANRTWSLLTPMPTTVIHSNTISIINKSTGRLMESWGRDQFIMPHGLTVDEKNNIWVTDIGLHQVFKFSHDGALLLTLGEAKVSGNDSKHFNMPTDVAVDKDGSFYVSDGYGNSRIMKFSPAGEYLFEWGTKGSKPGEFNIPHGIDLDRNGNVYVADRENSRIQIFNSSGAFLKQWNDASFGRILSVGFDGRKERFFATDDFTFLGIKHRGSDIIVFDTLSQVQSRFGRSGFYEGPACWYHDIAIDRMGNVYVADILGNRIQKFVRNLTPPSP